MEQQNSVPPRRPPVSALPLGYAPVDPKRRGLGRHFSLGLLFPVLYCLLVLWAPRLLPYQVQDFAAFAAVAGFFISVIAIRVATGWRGFIPGVLAMVLGLPLLAFGACAVFFAFY
jgi:hypothetical protein